MNKLIIYILLLTASLSLWSCSDDKEIIASDSKVVAEKTVAVILPEEKGLDTHWHRCLELFSYNFNRAFAYQDQAVKLNFEFYDEFDSNIDSIVSALSMRDDIYAIIGGLYSSRAANLASGFTRVGKTFFTIATSEELIRAFAPSGYLWAMTETDITQCEVLLSRVVNYGGESVALIAKDNDIYGKTFLDWFAFQAKELGLKNMGVFPYSGADLHQAADRAMLSGADYVICVPSEIEEIGLMLDAYSGLDYTALPHGAPRLLFSDTGYGTDVLSLYGDRAEGIEGVTFGANPESGFDVSYSTFFGEQPTVGEAQLYDAAMLLGYAAWYQTLNPGVSLQSALRTIVSGTDLNMGSWTGEDMSLVISALSSGASPYVRGASGHLKFDSRTFSNVLSTTYYNYKVYNGDYLILDYNTSDGSNRTEATLAGWNWKASLMQEFEETAGLSYPEHKGNWAVLVATSTGWENYRHQSDVLAIYQTLKSSGFDDDHIILIAEDDIAFNNSNPEQGVIRVTPGGANVYNGVMVDYRLSDLSPEGFAAILTGEPSRETPVVLESTENDNVFLFWSGHGVPGAMSWNGKEDAVNGEFISRVLSAMEGKRNYRKLLMMVEACYSGSVMEKCEGVPGMLFITAANAEETSKADIFNGEMKVWMTNRFTSTFIDQITSNPEISMRDLYYRLFTNTLGSHVTVYNARNFGNIYSSDLIEFTKYKGI